MTMQPNRFLNIDWNLADKTGEIDTWEKVGVAVLMDIRRELRRLNDLLACPNFRRIPMDLRKIATNTAQTKRSKKPRRGGG